MIDVKCESYDYSNATKVSFACKTEKDLYRHRIIFFNKITQSIEGRPMAEDIDTLIEQFESVTRWLKAMKEKQ